MVYEIHQILCIFFVKLEQIIEFIASIYVYYNGSSQKCCCLTSAIRILSRNSNSYIKVARLNVESY